MPSRYFFTSARLHAQSYVGQGFIPAVCGMHKCVPYKHPYRNMLFAFPFHTASVPDGDSINICISSTFPVCVFTYTKKFRPETFPFI